MQQREDVQLNKFFLPFSGWFLTPKFRYYLYVWSANTVAGRSRAGGGRGEPELHVQPARDAGRRNHQPAQRAQHRGPVPLLARRRQPTDADEFFRGSYTTGFWLKGELTTKLKYMAMIGNNLSTLGVSASQLDNKLNTTSFMLQWLPTTGEFGLYGTFGDYDHHEKVATRLAGHYTHSPRTSRASRAPTASRTARSGSPTAASSSRPTCSARGSPWTR